MTPQRARTLARRWFVAGLALIPATLILDTGALAPLTGPLAMLGGIICGTQVAHWLGWARGYKAAEQAREDQEWEDGKKASLLNHLRLYAGVDVPNDVAILALKQARAEHDHLAAPIIVKRAAQIIRTNSQPYQERPGTDGMMRPWP